MEVQRNSGFAFGRVSGIGSSGIAVDGFRDGGDRFRRAGIVIIPCAGFLIIAGGHVRFGRPEVLAVAAVMLDLERGQFQRVGTVEELVHRRDLIGNGAVVHRRDRVGVGIAGGEAHHLTVALAVLAGDAGDLVPQQQAVLGVGGQFQVHLIGHFFVDFGGGRIRDHILPLEGRRFVMGETVIAGSVVAIVQRAFFRFILGHKGRRGGVRGHAPAPEEVGQVLFRCGGSQAHEVLPGIVPQRQTHAAGRRRFGRRAGVGIHPREEAAVQQVVVIIIQFVAVVLVIGKVKLPVHRQLGEHIGVGAGGAAGDFVIDVLVVEAHAAIRRLRKLGEVVVGDFGHRIAAVVDVMADLMRDAPAEIGAVLVRAVLIAGNGHAVGQAGHRTPLDADVVARRIHEGPGEHPHIADIQMLGGQVVGRSRAFQIRQALVLVEQFHHLVHGVQRMEQFFRAAVIQARQKLRDRHRVHHLIQQDVGGVQDAVFLIVAFLRGVQFRMEFFQAGSILRQFLHIGFHARFAVVLVGDLVEVQRGDLRTAADADRVAIVGVLAGVLHIQRPAALGIRAADLLDWDHVAAHLEVDGGRRQLAALGMVLGRHQLQRGLGPVAAGVAAHIDQDLVACLRGHAQRLPRVQAGDVQAAVVGRHDAGMHVDHRLQFLVQQFAGIVQFPFERVIVGVLFAVAPGVQTRLHPVDLRFVHVVAQRQVQVVGVQIQNLIFQAVVGVEAHFRNGDQTPGAIPLLHADAQVVGLHTAGDRDDVVVAAAVAAPGDANIGDFLFLAVRAFGVDPNAVVVAVVLRLRQRDAADVVFLIESDPNAAARFVFGICNAIVPVIDLIPGGIVVVDHTPGGGFLVLRTAHHVAAVAVRHALNMGRVPTEFVSRIDEFIFRQLHRADVDRAGHRSEGGRAFAQLVHAGDVHFIGRIVLQALDGVGSAADAFNAGEVALPLHTVVQVVGIRIVHVLPVGFDAPVTPGQRQAVGRGGQLVRTGRDFHRFGIAAAPRAVAGLHLDRVGHAVFQLLAPEGADRQAVDARAERFGRGGLAVPGGPGDLHLVAGHIGLGVPAQRKAAVAGFGCQFFRDVHLRGRDALLHIVDEFHLGNFGQILAVGSRRDLDGDLFHRDLPTKVHHDGTVRLHCGALSREQRKQRRGVRRSRGFHRKFVRFSLFILHKDGGSRHGSRLLRGKGLQNKAAHFYGFLVRLGKLKVDQDRVLLRNLALALCFQFDRAPACQQGVQVARRHLRSLHRLRGDHIFGDAGADGGLDLARIVQAGGQHLQVHKVHDAAAVQVARTVAVHMIHQQVHVRLFHLAVAVHITDAQHAGVRLVGGKGFCLQGPGAQLHRGNQIPHLDLLGVGGKAAAGDRQRIQPRRQAAQTQRFAAVSGQRKGRLFDGIPFGVFDRHRKGGRRHRQALQDRDFHGARRLFGQGFRLGQRLLLRQGFLLRLPVLQRGLAVLRRGLLLRLFVVGSGFPGGFGAVPPAVLHGKGIFLRGHGGEFFPLGIRSRGLCQNAEHHRQAQQSGGGFFHAATSFLLSAPHIRPACAAGRIQGVPIHFTQLPKPFYYKNTMKSSPNCKFPPRRPPGRAQPPKTPPRTPPPPAMGHSQIKIAS